MSAPSFNPLPLSRRPEPFSHPDYSASIETPFEVGKLIEASHARVEALQSSIRAAFQALGAGSCSWADITFRGWP